MAKGGFNMLATWTPPKNTEEKSPGRELWEKVFGSDFPPEKAFVTIEQGLSTAVLLKFETCVPGVILSVPAVLGISERTLARRRSHGRLTPVESDRLFRLIALYAQAADVLGSLDAAEEWMHSPAVALGDKTPIEYAMNEAGAKRVEQLLTRIDDGVFS
jgi:putative toxin-antitoxin system antitoxin component (TIGR02293 family)